MTAIDTQASTRQASRAGRALPGLDGAIHANLPQVDRVVDERSFNVTVDVSQQVDFEALALAILQDPDLAWRFRVLALNKSTTELRVRAGAALRASAGVRAALTLTLGPSQAEDLSEHLNAKSCAPDLCAHLDGCSKYVAGNDTLCGEHLTDLEEHGPIEDRGSYDPWAG